MVLKLAVFAIMAVIVSIVFQQLGIGLIGMIIFGFIFGAVYELILG